MIENLKILNSKKRKYVFQYCLIYMLIRQWNDVKPIQRVRWEPEGRGQFYYKFHVTDSF